jgi:putative RNA 2'-phosphotransferase
MDVVKTSKFLSLVLRHEPHKLGLTLDTAGWVSVSVLLDALQQHNRPLTRAQLEHIVVTNNKQRFAFSEDGQRIRANQGHSVEIELGYELAVPPAVLYHGTATRFLDSIRAQGLVKGARHHVHLSADEATARNVGTRHGKPVILIVQAAQMHEVGYDFFLSANGVWLTDHVPHSFLVF